MCTVAIPVYAQSEAEIIEQEAKLRAEYDVLQKEIDHWQGVVDETRKKASNIQGDITGLTAKIKEAEAQIKQKNLAISQLSVQINSKTKKITELEGKISTGKESLAQLIRKTNEIDSYTIAEVMFANKDLSDFFQDIDSFASIKEEMKKHFTIVREAKANTEEEKEQLGVKKNEEADAKYIVETRKKTIAESEAEKKKLLAITKEEEKTYQTVLAERQARAAQIRAALFRLRDTEGIQFGKALEYANGASQKTGVRASLILAILTQESDLGKNQGSCLLSSIETGDGVGKNTGTIFQKVMKSPRDTIPFEDITKRLGRDWKMTPVSCPPGTTYLPNRGYGGGMGPSQFIPSTWELFKARIGQSVGVNAAQADPWNPAHSFVATAIYLSDLGAISGSYSSERNAACRYYSGRSCDGKQPANSFYGNSVMEKAEEIQSNIDFLMGV
jgi:peptidoglycan hydrolase CwlO-like protein